MAYLSYPDPRQQRLMQDTAYKGYEGPVEDERQGYLEGVMDGARSTLESGFEATVGAARQGIGAVRRRMDPRNRPAAYQDAMDYGQGQTTPPMRGEKPGYFEGVMDGARGTIESGYEATVGAARQAFDPLSRPGAYQDPMDYGQGQMTPPMRGELPGRMESAGRATQQAARKAAGATKGAIQRAYDKYYPPLERPGAYQDMMSAGRRGVRAPDVPFDPEIPAVPSPTMQLPDTSGRRYGGDPRTRPYGPQFMQEDFGPVPESMMQPQEIPAVPEMPTPQDTGFMANLIDELKPAAQRMYGGAMDTAKQAVAKVRNPDLAMQDPMYDPGPDVVPAPRQTPAQSVLPSTVAPMSTPLPRQAPVPRQPYSDYPYGQVPAPQQGSPRYGGQSQYRTSPTGSQFMQESFPAPQSPAVEQQRLLDVPQYMEHYMPYEPTSALDKIKAVGAGVVDFIVPGAEAQQASQFRGYTPEQFEAQYGVKKKPVARRR